MNSSGLTTLVLGLTFGLGSGFILANNNYRARQSENYDFKLQIADSQEEAPETSSKSLRTNDLEETKNTLTEDLTVKELDQAISKADQDQNNLQLQRGLGLALFKYAVIEQKTDFLPQAVRLLERAEAKLSPKKDVELYRTLGDARFILGRLNQPEKMLSARAAYQKALASEPGNTDLLISIGLTFFYEQPSNPFAAIKQYKQALELQPSHQKGLENLIIALIASRQSAEAGITLEKLQKINPQNLAINDLQIQINQQISESR